MSLLDVRLSTRVEQGFSAVRVANTRVVPLKNGHERRNANWSGKKRRYTSRYATFTADEAEELLAFSEIADGRANSFRFKDWSDFKATAQPLGTAPSGTTPVQLQRTYTRGAYSRVRTITKPVDGTVVVYQNGTPKAGTVDTSTGLFTPSTSWTGGATLTADFQFDVPVRFATDEIEFVLPHRDIFEVNCDLVEVFGE